MRLQSRLARLEARQPRGCPTCREWGMRVEYDPPEGADRCRAANGSQREQPPARCLTCGSYTYTIVVQYTDTWRGLLP